MLVRLSATAALEEMRLSVLLLSMIISRVFPIIVPQFGSSHGIVNFLERAKHTRCKTQAKCSPLSANASLV